MGHARRVALRLEVVPVDLSHLVVGPRLAVVDLSQEVGVVDVSRTHLVAEVRCGRLARADCIGGILYVLRILPVEDPHGRNRTDESHVDEGANRKAALPSPGLPFHIVLHCICINIDHLAQTADNK